MVQLSHLYMTIWKTIAFTIQTFVSKMSSLTFIMLYRFVLPFLPRSNHLLISWLQSPSPVTLETKQIKSATSTFHTSIFHEVMGPDAMILVFECWVLSQLFHSSLSPSSRGSLVPFHFLPLEWYHLHIWGCWYFYGNIGSTLWFIQPFNFTWYFLHLN